MDLKKLLGDKYKENMTYEEVAAALAGVSVVDKATFDKTASEAADYKKQLRAKQTDEEKAEAERAEKDAATQKELESLRRESAVSKHKAQFLGLGYDEALAAATAEALADGDMATVFANQKKAQENAEKALRAQLLQEESEPPAGQGGGTKIDYGKKAQEASASGDFAAAAYYTRLGAEEAARNNK